MIGQYISALGAPLLTTPSYRLIVNGQNITPSVNGRLLNLTLTDNREGEADTLEITLSDHDGNLALPPHGATIELALGWQGELIEKGSYTVDETEHAGSPDTITLRARSANFNGALPGTKSRSWHQKTLGDIVNQIAQEHSLQAVISPTLAGIRRGDTQQTAESDLSLLNRLGDLYDATATVKQGKLLFIKKATATTASGKAMPRITLARTSADQHSYTRTQRDAYGGVKAKWNNVAGARHQWAIAGSGENAYQLKATYATEADAIAAANSEWAKLQRGLAQLTITLAKGNVLLAPEVQVVCKGWKKEIDETEWVITRVVHTLGDNGLGSRLEAEEK